MLASLLLVRTATAFVVYAVNPALLRERARFPLHREQLAADKVLLLAVVTTGYAGVPLVAGLDVFRWHVLPTPSPVVSALGLVLFNLGWTIKALALRTNAFATTAVRLQRDRKHTVVDTGVYAIVRHPFYAGTPLVLIGLALWLESFLAVLVAIVPLTLMVIRLRLEERLLLRELVGYAQYVRRVPRRLIPGIW